MTQTLTRTGIVEPSGDGSDPFDPVTYLRNLAAWAEAQGALYVQGLLSARPAAGKVGRFYRATDDAAGVIYYDDGTAWQTIGAGAVTDAAANVGSLRTLGSGALQAAAGSHTHAIGAITGAGGAASLNVGTTAGTVAAGNHTHPDLAPLYAYKPADTSRASTTTRAADPDLSLTLGVGTWLIDADLMVASSSNTPDFNVALTFGGTSTLRFGPAVLGPAASSTDYTASTVNLVAGSSSATFGTTNNIGYVRVRAVYVVSASGALAVAWAQGTSDATSTTLMAGSHLIARKLA